MGATDPKAALAPSALTSPDSIDANAVHGYRRAGNRSCRDRSLLPSKSQVFAVR